MGFFSHCKSISMSMYEHHRRHGSDKRHKHILEWPEKEGHENDKQTQSNLIGAKRTRNLTINISMDKIKNKHPSRKYREQTSIDVLDVGQKAF